MPIARQQLEQILQGRFPNGEIICKDLAGDNDHWEVHITDACFAGKSRIMQHKMVQEAVKNYDVHALSIKTQVP